MLSEEAVTKGGGYLLQLLPWGVVVQTLLQLRQ